ncbi:general substrate transporter [Choiromyces venosus 120613-1]|uniref:General substrate transporter n=1 Tax=Choiromyces venosus 120613-1 TaxID=1336337 RepID=A0A3N4K252_9PEZI|nr:general substrate transporter [Choiromyces venosus 120613-1]
MFKLYFFLFVAFLNSCINGYDGSLMGGINAMKYYQTYFNMETVGSGTGLVFSVYTVGNIVGSFFCGPFTDWWGRRWGMFIGASIIIAGTCTQAPATSRAMFTGGRFILGFGVATCATAGPSYVAEMSHPAWRGTLTGLYNTFWFVGGIPATWALYGTEHIESDLSWRLPIWFQAVAPGLVMLGCLFCPETPRWLVSNDRHEEAIRVMARYHGEGDRNSPIVLLTYREMIEEIATEGSDKRWWDYKDLFNSKSAWWRLSCVVGMAFFGQWSGNGAVSYFMPVLLNQIGVKEERTQLLYNAILNVISFVMATIGARFVDRLGRRVVLLVGTSLFVVWWTIITTLTALYGTEENDNTYGSRSAIAFIYIFGITYSFSYTPLQALYPVECLSYETRAKGMGMYNLFVNIAAFFNTYAIPTVWQRIKWRFYFVYIAWDVFEVVFIYFLFVETKGRTLEEINEIFEAPYPKRKSMQKHIVVITDRGILDKGLEEHY